MVTFNLVCLEKFGEKRQQKLWVHFGFMKEEKHNSLHVGSAS